MKTRRTILVLNLLTVALAAVGESTWITFENSKTITYQSAVSLPSDCKKVAYTIDENKAITYYLTIESALEHTTSGIIYVIPGTNPTITRDCEIKSGVTLCIPYDDNGDGTHSDYTNLENQSNNGFADKDADSVAKNRKNLITIASGVTLTNNGVLEVAGKVGVGNSSQRPSGFTLGDYCEMLLESDAKIQNNGSINLYGYIKESSSDNGSSVEHSSTGMLKMPFTIYDFRGGTFSSNAYTKNSMPFNYFDFPNCHANQLFNYGSKLTGIALLYASNTYYSSEITVLSKESDDCLFKMSNGSVNIKYCPSTFGYTTADVSNTTTSSTANYTKVTIDGDLSLSSFVIKVSWYTFNSASVECPICYKYQITQNSGTLTIANKMKFLSGSSLTITEDAKCIINASTTFYEGYTPKMTVGSSAHSPQNMGRAKLIVNGELQLNSNFGGLINCSISGGTVVTSGEDETDEDNNIIGDKFKPYFETNEMLDNSNWVKHIEYAEAYALIDSKPSTFRLKKGETYQLIANGNYWDNSSSTDITSFTLDNPSGTSDDKKAKTYTVTATHTYAGVTYSSSNITYNWQVSSSSSESGTYTTIEKPDSTMLAVKDNVATFTTPAATLESVYYKLTCTISFDRIDGTADSMNLTSGIYEAYYSSSCILPTSRILMADGTYKEAGLIRIGDMVLSFNHETGKLEPNVIIGNQHLDDPAREHPTVHLEFSNGASTDFIFEHGYFDTTLNKYVYMHADDYEKYIGHEFVFVSNDHKISRVRLVKASVNMIFTQAVSPITANHLNIITDNMLSMPSGVTGAFNIFEYDPQTLAFDKEKMREDVDKYGLLGYEVFKKYIPEKIYNLLPCKYFGVSIGKGLLTWKKIDEYASKWKKQLLENM